MSTQTTGPRETFAATALHLVASRADVALVFAEISGQYFEQEQHRHPDRILNVGIREQLLVSVGAGLALTGMRPIVHTFSTFLVERAFEQIKLDFAHQGVGGVLVGSAGSFDVSSGGRSHQAPGDIALIDTLPEVTIHAPSTVPEVQTVLRRAVADTGLHYVRMVEQTNTDAHLGTGLHVIRRGAGVTVIALGPVVDDVLAATAGQDATVLYAHTVRPFDAATLRAVVGPDVVLVEPWLVGTSAYAVGTALRDLPHRLLCLGVRRSPELRRYGSDRDHIRAHGLDAAGLRAAITRFTRR